LRAKIPIPLIGELPFAEEYRDISQVSRTKPIFIALGDSNPWTWRFA